MLKELLTNEQISNHAQRAYSVKVKGITKLDWNVHRVDLEGGTSCVAPVFPANDQTAIECLAKLLRHVHRESVSQFPAEELVSPPVTTTEDGGACVMVTNFVHGKHPERNRATFFRLGKLLGQLHAMDLGHDLGAGGSWRHLCLAAGIEQECDTAVMMLRESQNQLNEQKGDSNSRSTDIDKLIVELEKLAACFQNQHRVLPKCIVHPDFVQVNIIEETSSFETTEDPKWTIVDWTGAGVGYRVVSLGFLLSVAAVRGKMVLVDAVMKGYSESITLEDSELEVLLQAVYARFFTIDCWKVVMGMEKAMALVEGMTKLTDLGENVAKRVRDIVKRTKSYGPL